MSDSGEQLLVPDKGVLGTQVVAVEALGDVKVFELDGTIAI